MSARALSLPVFLLFAAACSGDPRGPLPEAPTGPGQSSEVVFQAVDAGTGGALTDERVTVRYLVRTPITLDAVAAEAVSSAEPYRIAHEVATDSLVLEVRLEAPSYHRLDTTLAVARGASAGPLTVRMSRRLDRAAQAPTTRPAAGGARPTTPTPAAGQPAPPPDPDAGLDRSALQAGDQAFGAGNWFEAAAAYERMPAPTGTGAYARAYQQGMVNRGISHINLAEMGAAMDALELATDVDIPNHQAFRYTGHVMCAVGRVDDGLDALDELEDMASDIPASERGVGLAMGKFEEATCRKIEFERTEGTLNRVRTSARAIEEFEAFLEQAGALGSPPAEVTESVTAAQAAIDEIRARMRRGGE